MKRFDKSLTYRGGNPPYAANKSGRTAAQWLRAGRLEIADSDDDLEEVFLPHGWSQKVSNAKGWKR